MLFVGEVLIADVCQMARVQLMCWKLSNYGGRITSDMHPNGHKHSQLSGAGAIHGPFEKRIAFIVLDCNIITSDDNIISRCAPGAVSLEYLCAVCWICALAESHTAPAGAKGRKSRVCVCVCVCVRGDCMNNSQAERPRVQTARPPARNDI